MKKLYFKLYDYESEKFVESTDKDIEYTYACNVNGGIINHTLTVWRTKNKTMKLGDLEADVECYDFINEYDIIELYEKSI